MPTIIDMEIIEANDEIENIENLFDFEDSSCPPWEDDAKGPHTATDDSFLTCDASRTCVSPVPPTSAPTCCLGLDTSKAGMEGLDKGRIEQIITQASMGSKFYKNEVRKEKQLAARIVQMKKDLEAVTQAQQQAFCRSADAEMASLERERNLGHIVVHIDMDAFYAAVEMRDNPSLRDVPMAVGGMGMLVSGGHGDVGQWRAWGCWSLGAWGCWSLGAWSVGGMVSGGHGQWGHGQWGAWSVGGIVSGGHGQWGHGQWGAWSVGGMVSGGHGQWGAWSVGGMVSGGHGSGGMVSGGMVSGGHGMLSVGEGGKEGVWIEKLPCVYSNADHFEIVSSIITHACLHMYLF